MNEIRKNGMISQEPEAPVKKDEAALSDEELSSVAGGVLWWKWSDASDTPQTDTLGDATNAADTGRHYPGI